MAARLQSMCEYWRNFDLPELQKELDVSATELAARQDQSEASRKKLVEQSKEFKKHTPEDVRKLVAQLLKDFQAEIDSLSKRSKNAEAAFLSIYKRLIDAPDPVPWLESAVTYQKKSQRGEDLEIENHKLRETLDEYNHEFAEVKNQEVTIKQLREKLKDSEGKTEVSAQLRAKEKEKQLQRQFTEKERQLQETQLAVAKKLGEAEHRVATLQSALDAVQAETFDVRTKYEESTSAKSDEMDMIMSDLERANERASSAERQVEQLRRQLTAAEGQSSSDVSHKTADMEQAIDILKRSSLEVELAAKEKEISQLVEDVQKLQVSLGKLRETSATQIARLEEELGMKSRALQVLQERMRTQADYEELKRELNIMKSIEFSTPGEQDSSSAVEPKSKSLDVLLLEKNKGLQTENTQLKVAHNDLTSEHSDLLVDEHSRELPKIAESESSKIKIERLGDRDSEYSETSKEFVPKDLKSPPIVAEIPEVKTEPPEFKKQTTFGKMDQSRASSSSSSTPSTPGVHLQHPGADMFVTMLGQDLMANFHLQNQMLNGHILPRFPLPVSLPNGFPTHPELLKRLQPNSPPMGPLLNGHVTPSHQLEGVKLQRPSCDIKIDVPSNQVLDTAEVALRIREVLSANNIGQRLFAKHVLGLSQGTVSELLSKPKHWDKLTEKGRESYRKMYSWANSHHHVQALKAISPKKGGQPIVTNNKQENAQTEERITAILHEAQTAMAVRQSQERTQIANAMVASIYQHELAKMSGIQQANQKASLHTQQTSSNGDPNRDPRMQPDSGRLTQEIVAKIYREELLKLALAAEKCGNFEESNMYRQELLRLEARAQQELLSARQTKTEENKENLMENNNIKVAIKDETVSRIESERMSSSDLPQDLRINTGSHSPREDAELRHSGSAFSIVRPRSTSVSESQNSPSAQAQSTSGMLNSPEDLSPLERMQSIANSLVGKQNGAGNCQKPLKAVLPPVSQELFDKYSNINTDDLVKRVKETLSQYSISQRLFGESVLGLSQGSVSDLLARPKPWHMLTQKGREPFIRMQIFLEDQEAIPRLVANQYRIAPEKLLRTNSMVDNTQVASALENDPSPLPGPSHVLLTRDRTPTPQPLPSPPRPTLTPVQLSAFPSLGALPAQFPMPHPYAMDPTLHLQAVHPNIFEVAALTQDLDTMLITSKVKEILQFHNLGQKLFGEAILALSQGSVSELLSKPKPWHMLSLKGREPFIKMHLWLNDPHNIDRLRFYQNELKANRKRRYSLEERNLDHSFNSSGSSSSNSNKKPRVFFTEDQREMLRVSYNKDPYPSQARIDDLAATLGVGNKTIVNWFHNHRMRAKQVQGLGSPTMVPHQPFSGSHWEDNSTNSDNSESHSDCGSQPLKSNARFAAGSPDDASGRTQWMFPSFEPMRNSDGFPQSAQDLSAQRRHMEDDVTGENEAEDLSVPKSRDQERYHDDRHSPEVEMSIDNNDTSHSKVGENGSSGLKPTNRRKSSRPQWVFEGTQLNKSHANGTNAPHSDVEKRGGDAYTERSLDLVKQVKNNNCGETSDSSSHGSSHEQNESSTNRKKRKLESSEKSKDKIVKLQSSVQAQANGDDWEQFD